MPFVPTLILLFYVCMIACFALYSFGVYPNVRAKQKKRDWAYAKKCFKNFLKLSVIGTILLIEFLLVLLMLAVMGMGLFRFISGLMSSLSHQEIVSIITLMIVLPLAYIHLCRFLREFEGKQSPFKELVSVSLLVGLWGIYSIPIKLSVDELLCWFLKH